jgi:hypothetical protein
MQRLLTWYCAWLPADPQGLRTVDTRTGEKAELPVRGLFYGIGHQPNSKLIAGQVDLDEAGYVKVRGQARGRVWGHTSSSSSSSGSSSWGIHSWAALWALVLCVGSWWVAVASCMLACCACRHVLWELPGAHLTVACYHPPLVFPLSSQTACAHHTCCRGATRR